MSLLQLLFRIARRRKPKIFCIGLNKTGTTSFGDALESIGYSRLGWTRLHSPGLVTAYFEGNFDKIFDKASKYDVLEDIPWPLCFKELEEHFPNAKFVLTVRKDTDTWLKSIDKHIKGDYTGHKKIYGYFRPSENPEAFQKKYAEHNAAVEEYFKDKPSKLLKMCFENGDDWKQLAPFLGIPTPRKRWPHSNKTHPQ